VQFTGDWYLCFYFCEKNTHPGTLFSASLTSDYSLKPWKTPFLPQGDSSAQQLCILSVFNN